MVENQCIGAPPRRPQARLTVELTEREARALLRATLLVADVLRPELLRESDAAESPLVTGYQALLAACERQGVELGLAPPLAARLPHAERG